jgi:hypothetical protein
MNAAMTTTDQDGSRQESRSWVEVTLQWLSVVGPPIAAFAQQQLAYSLVSPSCLRRAPILLHAPTLVMLVLIAVAAWYSWRQWKHYDGQRASDDRGQAASLRFFALLGLTMCGISTILVVAQWLPTLFLDPCIQ